MSPRATQRWFAWLLPLLVLRAFVPAGFMPSFTDAGLQMVLCAGMAPATSSPTVDAAVHEHSHHHHVEQAAESHEHHGGDSQVHENSICPFAAAGTPGVATTFPATVIALSVEVARFDFRSAPYFPSALTSTHRIRGPPSIRYS